MKIKLLEKKGIEAVKILRESKFRKGLPFMINTKELPSHQCYLEYPDGSVKLVKLSRTDNDFKIIEEFSQEQGEDIRKRFMLG